jgi:putative endonuclease
MTEKRMAQKNERWFLYVVECSDGSLYTGITVDIDRRINEHNFGKKGAKYTRSRRPVRLVHAEIVQGRSDALSKEAAFKKLSRKKKLIKISGSV